MGGGGRCSGPPGRFLLLQGVGDISRPPRLSTPEHQPVSVSASSRLGGSPSVVPRGSQNVKAEPGEAKRRGALSCPCLDPVPPQRGGRVPPCAPSNTRVLETPRHPCSLGGQRVGEGRGREGRQASLGAAPLEGGAGCPLQGSRRPSNRQGLPAFPTHLGGPGTQSSVLGDSPVCSGRGAPRARGQWAPPPIPCSGLDPDSWNLGCGTPLRQVCGLGSRTAGKMAPSGRATWGAGCLPGPRSFTLHR